MGRGGIPIVLRCWYLELFTLLLKQGVMSKSCVSSQCGIVTNISNPFRLRDDPPNCGDPTYELACENNVTLLHLYSGTYHVLGINYTKNTIRLRDADIREGDCSSLPRYILSQSNFTDTYSISASYNSSNPYTATLRTSLDSELITIFKHVIYLNCSDPVRDDPDYMETAPCVNWKSEGEGEGGGHVYAVAGDLVAKKMRAGCYAKMVTPLTSDWGSFVKKGESFSYSYAEIHRALSHGFEVSWWQRACADLNCSPNGFCSFSPQNQTVQCSQYRCHTILGTRIPCDIERERMLTKLLIYVQDYIGFIVVGLMLAIRKRSYKFNAIFDFSETQNLIGTQDPVALSGTIIGRYIVPIITIRFLFGMVLLLGLLIHRCRRRHLSMYGNIEEFLQLHNLLPIRYSYKELKIMTQGFKTKIGKGGFGTVYKGKLRSGPEVAIKMLDKSKVNDQEFISEVATIGRIHHFNVVHLVGFCVEGTKRALVYDFMSNGSLDKHIFSKEESVSLSYDKIFEISLGIAHGIAYLHHECDIQILHFDIKPHNILLDDNFIPKVSDFGLARLYHVDDSNVTLTAARGTIGYMAPELFYKNVGRVSYKADIYSFGMLLMEMASQKRNLNAHAEHSSQIYFPLWIYDQLDQGKDIEMKDLTEEEKNLARKMFIVALWCIQLKPADRPTMNKVIEMLETDDVQNLEMPPDLSLYPDEANLVDEERSSNQAASSDFLPSSSTE